MVRNIYAGTVTSKGQVTVPKAIRERLGLRQGDQLEFVEQDSLTVVRRAATGTNPFSAYAGSLKTFPKGRKQINAWVRELRDADA